MTVRWSGIHTSIAMVDEKNNRAYLSTPSPDITLAKIKNAFTPK